MSAIDEFLHLVEAFRSARGYAEATVSSRIFNDSGRISEIRRGGDVGARRLDRALTWLSDHWPADQPWPAEVRRPGRDASLHDPPPDARLADPPASL